MSKERMYIVESIWEEVAPPQDGMTIKSLGTSEHCKAPLKVQKICGGMLYELDTAM